MTFCRIKQMTKQETSGRYRPPYPTENPTNFTSPFPPPSPPLSFFHHRLVFPLPSPPFHRPPPPASFARPSWEFIAILSPRAVPGLRLCLCLVVALNLFASVL